ncbi:hypothetical protein C8Q80DRAFT_1139250 [Daedaleopsis nitida]|nr:hypothetical protein C8Q80DRAFT_1139250 [Daedaleopsis nitida]
MAPPTSTYSQPVADTFSAKLIVTIVGSTCACSIFNLNLLTNSSDSLHPFPVLFLVFIVLLCLLASKCSCTRRCAPSTGDAAHHGTHHPRRRGGAPHHIASQWVSSIPNTRYENARAVGNPGNTVAHPSQLYPPISPSIPTGNGLLKFHGRAIGAPPTAAYPPRMARGPVAPISCGRQG